MTSRFDRVLLVRHLAICAGAVMAYVLRTELRIGYTALWIVAVSALLNLAAFVLGARPSLARASQNASPVIGVGSWAALTAVTGGATSPFIAGLWLEVVLSAVTFRRPTILYVTAAGVAALWAQELWRNPSGIGTSLALQTAFLAGVGGATWLVTGRWIRAQQALTETRDELASRLDALRVELDGERALGRIADGENVGRLAHGIKNAVHSLRGFASLMEPRIPKRGGGEELAGLRAAIDDLEALARLTLDPGRRPLEPPTTPDCVAAVETVLGTVSRSVPGISWSTRVDGESCALAIPESEFSEILEILLRNAAQAMNGAGEARVEMGCKSGEFTICVQDDGAGLSPEARGALFRPGFTTKLEGSGYGLFLARRIAEAHGGHLDARDGGRRAGAIFELSLPLAGAASPASGPSPRSGLGG